MLEGPRGIENDPYGISSSGEMCRQGQPEAAMEIALLMGSGSSEEQGKSGAGKEVDTEW